MSWRDRLRDAATRALDRVTEGAEKGARYVAQHGPGFIGQGASELLAEREYKRARQLAEEGLGKASAPEVIAILLPYWQIDGHYACLINRLLGRAYDAAGDSDAATEHLGEALRLLRDNIARRGMEPTLYEEHGILSDELEAEVLIDLARLALDHGELDECIRHAMQAVDLDRRAMEAYYYQGAAMLRKGIDRGPVAELFMRAMSEGDEPEKVVEWVRALMPENLEWFERLAG